MEEEERDDDDDDDDDNDDDDGDDDDDDDDYDDEKDVDEKNIHIYISMVTNQTHQFIQSIYSYCVMAADEGKHKQ